VRVQQLALASGDEEYQNAATEVIREMTAAVTALVVRFSSVSVACATSCALALEAET
jgi:hypothetical protein